MSNVLSAAHPDANAVELIHVGTNGEHMLLVNRHIVATCWAPDDKELELEAVNMAKALGVDLIRLTVDAPECKDDKADDEWQFRDALKQLPAMVREDFELVGYWNDNIYTGEDENTEGMQWACQINDQRRSSGQLYVDLYPVEGDLDDGFSLTIEVNRLGQVGASMPCVHVHFDGDNMAFSLFKQNDKFILRPEAEVELESRQIDLNNLRETIYIVK